MNNNYWFLLYPGRNEVVVSDTQPKSYGSKPYKPISGRIVIRSIFKYSKEGYKIVIEFKRVSV